MADWFVDNTNAPPGDGSNGNPFSSIANAFSAITNPTLAGGDHIKIRTGTGTYAESPTLSRAGAVGNPIVIEPDTANTPNIVGTSANPGPGLRIRASNITIQNLIFDGTGIQSRWAVVIEPITTANIQNITVTGCAITAMGGTEAQANNTVDAAAEGGILVRNTFSSQWTVDTFTISNNVIDNCRGYGFFISGVTNGTITGNEIKNHKRGREGTTGEGIIEVGIKLASDSSAPLGTISSSSGPHTISNNTIHDFQEASAWGISDVGTVGANIVGIYGDTSAHDATLTGNIIYKIAENTTTNAIGCGGTRCSFVNVIGIFVESQCNDWIVENNIVYRIGKTGIRVSSSPTIAAQRCSLLGNTIFDINGEHCIDIRYGTGHTIKNNIAYSTVSTVPCINFTSTTTLNSQGPHTIDYNDWYNSASTNIGKIGNTSYNFTNWKTQLASQIGQDAHSVNADPLFTSITTDAEDFHLLPGSPAINTGEGGISMGAYPGQIIVVPVISATTVSAIFFTGFTVTWTTDLAASSQVEYGTTVSYGTSTTLDSSLVTSHSVTVTGLLANTLYHFRVKSQASGGTTQNSGDFTVITVLPPPTSVLAT